MDIAIIGATRGIGREVLAAALAAGHGVTALVRNPEKLSGQKGLTLVQGDFADPAAVEKALSGAGVVVLSVGVPPTRKPVTLFSQGTENVLAAVRRAGSRPLIIAVTGIGAGDSAGHGGFLYDRIFKPLLLKTIYEDKDRQEELLARGYDNWIVVRPGFLTHGPATGNYRVLTDLTGVKAGKISRADVAHFIVSQVENPEYLRQAPLLTY